MSKQLTAIIVSTLLLCGCGAESLLRLPDPLVPPPSPPAKSSFNKSYTVKGKTYYPVSSASGYREQGVASWYGKESSHRTASGERYNAKGLSAAHKTLPIPTKVRVTNLRNGRHVEVLVNDRGPFSDNRLIDLSQGAAKLLGMNGLTEVEVESLED